MSDSELILTIVGGTVALASMVKAVAFLARGGRRLVHKLDAIDQLLTQELTHNHGSSIKDDVHGLALSIGEMQRDRDEDNERLNALLRLAAEHHPTAAQMYLALRR